MSTTDYPTRSAFKWFIDLQSRWEDNDAYGHINGFAHVHVLHISTRIAIAVCLGHISEHHGLARQRFTSVLKRPDTIKRSTFLSE